MKEPEIPENESQRLAALDRYKILDTPTEQVFDDVTRLAAHICQTPISLISLIDNKRQWFKSHHGLNVTETPREFAFCAHAINDNKVFIVDDSDLDERFKDNPLVTGDPHVRSYVGCPLATSDGYNIGTLCVIDHRPRRLSEEQIKNLEGLARLVVALIEKRKYDQEFTRQAVKIGDIGAFDHDHLSGKIEWSPECRKIFGWPDDENLTLLQWIDLIPMEEREVIASAIRAAHDPSSDGIYEVEHRIINSEGKVRWVRIKSQTFFRGVGVNRGPLRTVGAMIDITASKAQEASLRKAVADLANGKLKLERSNRELEQFASVAAHDLRSPLLSMQGWIGLLDSTIAKPRNEIVDKAIEFIRLNTQKANALIGDLLDVARVSTTNMKLETVDLNKLVGDLRLVLMQEFANVDPQIHINKLPSVVANAGQLESLFGNLIRNALIYRDKTRTPDISIGCSKEKEGYCEFFVKDNGIGIEPKYTQQIFEMFVRLHGEKDFPGTGIGLAFCKKVVELHGGKIWVSSMPGAGSTFYFTYPINDEPERDKA
jgi:PAS domain S-box-containing protein